MGNDENRTPTSAEELLERYKEGGRDFGGLNLRGVDLHGAYLEGATFEYADLRGAILRGAILRKVSFLEAKLSGADLSGADCSEAFFHNATIIDVNFRGIIRDGAHFDVPPETRPKGKR